MTTSLGVVVTKLQSIIAEEFAGLRPRKHLAYLILSVLPDGVGNRLRVRVLRIFGFRNIARNAMMRDLPTITGRGNVYRRLVMGPVSRFNSGCFLNLGAEIRIGERTGIGQQVMILTESHDIGGPDARSGNLYPKPVRIGDGCWIGARATILPGVCIGDGVVVASGSVVTKDVPDHVLVAGVPATVIRQLDQPATH